MPAADPPPPTSQRCAPLWLEAWTTAWGVTCGLVITDADLQIVLDVIGVFVFALSGAVVAVRARLDVIGVLTLAALAGLGGGITRDVILGATPPVGVSDWKLLVPALSAGLLVFVLYEPAQVVRQRHPGRVSLTTRGVRILDAAGLALFAVSGALKAVAFDTTWQAAILVGIITAVGGGLIRDILVNEVPEVLRRRDLYITPALIGASLIVVADALDVLGPVTIWAAVGTAFIVRLMAIWFGWRAPVPLLSRAAQDR